MRNERAAHTAIPFDDPDLLKVLVEMSHDKDQYDALDFGLIGMELDGTVIAYNKTESELAGIQSDRVLGENFFTDVAPCTNNYLVSGRFEEEAELDETIDYVLTLKMRPTRVQMRLLKNERNGRQYLAIKR